MKRGAVIDIALPLLYEIVIPVGILLSPALYSINQIGTSLNYEMQFYATDTALLVDGLYAVSPDVNLAVNYSKILPGLEFAFKPQQVEVSAEGTGKGKTFWFTGDSKYGFKSSTISNTSTLTFVRTGNTVGVQDFSKTINLNIPFCKPYHGPGLRDILLRSTPQTELLASYFRSWNPGLFGDGSGGIIGFGSNSVDVVKIFATRTDSSARFACLMAQAVSEKFPQMPVVLIPVNTAYLSEGDPKTALSLAVPSVYIELPSKLLASPRDVASILYEGVKDYGLA